MQPAIDDRATIDPPPRKLTALIELGVPGGRTGVRTHDAALALARQLAASRHVALSGLECYEGLQISGDTTQDGLARISLAIAEKPAIVLLELGANDGLRGVPIAVTQRNLAEMIEMFQKSGARVVLVARGEEKLADTKREIDAMGGRAVIYTADVSDLKACDALVQRVLAEQGGCDYLINNAGRSIRRGIINSFDRFHDFERTMQLNYFGAIRLILGFLPRMIEQKRGHIINISSIGVLSNAPRFSAYVASKSALDSFSACAASEFLDKNINFTTINMPLVRTPMIAPTKMYENIPTLSPEEAAGLVVEAIVHKPVRIATRLGVFGAVCHAVAPKLTQVLLNSAFHMFPDSSAAQGKKDGESQQLSPEQIAFAQLTQGIHW